jgi:hypothetical protein
MLWKPNESSLTTKLSVKLLRRLWKMSKQKSKKLSRSLNITVKTKEVRKIRKLQLIRLKTEINES